LCYKPKFKDEFEGLSYTLRVSNDELVISIGIGTVMMSSLSFHFIEPAIYTAGDIHLWDPNTGLPVHHFRAEGGSFLSTWNSKMAGVPGIVEFATGDTSGISFWKYGRIF
jgi:hypothetical protein